MERRNTYKNCNIFNMLVNPKNIHVKLEQILINV